MAEARRADAPSTSVQAGAAPSSATDRPGSPQGQAPTEDLLALVDAAWADIKTKVREFGLTLHALMSGAAVSRVEGQTIVFAHQSAPLAQRLSDPRNIESVRAAVRAVLGRELDVRWETGAPAARPAPQAKNTAGPAESKPAARPQFSRPSQAKGGRARTGKPDDDIPPPDFPDLPDDPGPQDSYAVDPARSGGESAGAPRPAPGIPAPPTPEEEQEMLAAAAVPVAPGDRQDPDEVALSLLRSELGAKSLDG